MGDHSLQDCCLQEGEGKTGFNEQGITKIAKLEYGLTGFKFARSSIRSGRFPFGVPLYVVGNSEIKLKSNAPLDAPYRYLRDWILSKLYSGRAKPLHQK